MNRELHPVYLQARAAVEALLARAGYQLASECHHPHAFGSALAEYRGTGQRLRLTWDGRDRWLGLESAVARSANHHPAPADWRAVEPAASDGASQFLEVGASTDRRVAQLEDALRRHLDAAI